MLKPPKAFDTSHFHDVSRYRPRPPIQRQVPENAREVDISLLPEEDAREHMMSMFKTKVYENPLVDQGGDLIQRTPSKGTHSGGDLFGVAKSDLNTGTDTTKKTRDHVNDASTTKPSAILFDFLTASTGSKARSGVVSNALAFETENPKADLPYSSGNYWDAGHKLGKQNGGLGDNNDWVFPQTPAYNQGNSKNMNKSTMATIGKTRDEWRGLEDEFHDGVASDGAGYWWIKLI